MEEGYPEELPKSIVDFVWMRKKQNKTPLLCEATEFLVVFVTQHSLSYPDYYTHFLPSHGRGFQ